MQAHGFDPGRVTYSVTDENPMIPNGECPASNPAYFGDSARVVELSMLTATIAGGGPFGSLNWQYDLPSPTDNQTPYRWTGFACGGSSIGASYLPVTHSSPTIVDVHSGPCVVIPKNVNSWGNCNLDAQSQSGVPTWANVQDEATAMGNALSAFQNSFSPTGWCGSVPNLANALVMLGETHGRLNSGCLMDPNATGPPLAGNFWDPSTGASTFAGFSSSSLRSTTLPNGLPANLVFRPWEYLQQGDSAQANACNTIYTNPPYTPVR
jgi:hypothetical protein